MWLECFQKSDSAHRYVGNNGKTSSLNVSLTITDCSKRKHDESLVPGATETRTEPYVWDHLQTRPRRQRTYKECCMTTGTHTRKSVLYGYTLILHLGRESTHPLICYSSSAADPLLPLLHPASVGLWPGSSGLSGDTPAELKRRFADHSPPLHVLISLTRLSLT